MFPFVTDNEITKVVEHEYGNRYVIEGWLPCPNGKSYPLRAIWFIAVDEEIPELVTAYPN
ncbi:DUF6883 domain-containing protein [Spirosoma fluminis]